MMGIAPEIKKTPKGLAATLYIGLHMA